MKSVLIIGMGRMGRHLAGKLQKLGNDVLIVDSNRDTIEALSEQFTDANICDCTNENVIRALGVDNFDICFVTIGEDFQSSLVITSLLKKYRARKIVAKANQEIQAELLRTIGADEIVNAEEELAEYLAVRYNSDNIFDYVPLTEDYSMYELPVPKAWVGKTPVELDIRKKYHINVIGVKNGNSMNPNLGADYHFRDTDHILVIGKFNEIVKIPDA
ncbi:MAG: TrkA family potassium uptake protein [Oscillospiraceae bacterium]|nr:TrkA family potassium uptake protein [Oscillospiraceae bacterium]